MSVKECCRLCASMSSSYINIFDEQGKKHLLFLKIISNLNIVLSEGDPLPKCVCILCIGKLNFAAEFKRDCQNAQVLLRKKLSKERLSALSLDNSGTLLIGETNSKALPSIDKPKSVSPTTDVETWMKTRLKHILFTIDCYEKNEEIIMPDSDEFVIKKIEDSEHNNQPNSFKINNNNGRLKDSFKSNNSISNDAANVDAREIDLNDSECTKTHKVLNFIGDVSENDKVVDISEIDEMDCADSVENDVNDDNDFETDDFNATSVVKANEFTDNNASSNNRISNSSQIVGADINDEGGETVDDNLKMNDCRNVKSDNVVHKEDGLRRSEISDQSGGNNSPVNCVKDSSTGLDQSITSGKSDDNPIQIDQQRSVYYSSSTTVVNPLYHRFIVRKYHETGDESLLNIIVLFKSLLEYTTSVMPYFTRFEKKSGSVRFGFKCPICHHPIFDITAIMKHMSKHFYLCCRICDRKWFSNITGFKYHFLKHHRVALANGKLKCEYCSSVFKEPDSYIKHAPCNFKYRCGVCSFTTLAKDDWVTHMLNTHEKEKENCINCAVFFYSNENELREHILNIGRSGFECGFCGMIFHNKEYLNVHFQIFGEKHVNYKSENNQDFLDNKKASNASSDNESSISALHKRISLLYNNSAKKCNQIIKLFLDILNKNILLKDLPLSKFFMSCGIKKLGFKCPACKGRIDVSREKTAIYHIQRHCLLICYDCKWYFNGISRFVDHCEKHKRDKLYKCIICENIPEFNNLKSYSTHIRHHFTKRFCKYCQMVLAEGVVMARHLRVVHKRVEGDQIFNKETGGRNMCDHCGKCYTSAYGLKTHIEWVHLKCEKNKLCSNCGVKYSTRTIHKCDQKPNSDRFICAYCSKTFFTKLSLRVHIIVHMDEKQYKCNFCEKRFNRESSLVKHKKDMHSFRKWSCDIDDCTSSYSYKSALVKHKKVSHKLENFFAKKKKNCLI